MTLGNPTAYRSLATIAAAQLGTSSPAIIAAILGQWTCEQPGGTWPPVHNNPGFLTVGAAKSNGIASTYATTSPGVHFLAVFPSPTAGAIAYGQYIARSAHYPGARAAVKRGDGAAYLTDICTHGYGTRLSCALSAYKKLGGSVPPSSAPVPGGSSSGGSAGGSSSGGVTVPAAATGTVVTVAAGKLASATDCKGTLTTLAPGPLGSNATVIPIPAELIGEAGRCTQCPPGWSFAVADPGPLRSLLPIIAGQWVDPKMLPPGVPNACTAPGVKAGDPFDAQAGVNAAGDVAGAIAAGLGAVIGPALVTAAELVGIIALGLLGVYFLFRGQGGATREA